METSGTARAPERPFLAGRSGHGGRPAGTDAAGGGLAPDAAMPAEALAAESLAAELLSTAMLFGLALVVTVGTVLLAGIVLGAL